MTTYRYFTKESLIEAAKAGNERGYNRQLDPEALAELEYTEFLPVTFTLPHEHIAGELVEPHVRVMALVGPDDTVTLDISWERYNSLPTYDPDTTARVRGNNTEDSGHRTGRKRR